MVVWKGREGGPKSMTVAGEPSSMGTAAGTSFMGRPKAEDSSSMADIAPPDL